MDETAATKELTDNEVDWLRDAENAAAYIGPWLDGWRAARSAS